MRGRRQDAGDHHEDRRQGGALSTSRDAPHCAESVMRCLTAQQGRFAQFHQAMYRLGPPSGETIAAAARAAGVNLDLAQAAISDGAFDAQLQTNVAMAQFLGIDGTPGWVAGNRILQGALGRQAIGQALREVRAS